MVRRGKWLRRGAGLAQGPNFQDGSGVGSNSWPGGSIDGSWGDFRLPPRDSEREFSCVGESLEDVVSTTNLRLKEARARQDDAGHSLLYLQRE